MPNEIGLQTYKAFLFLFSMQYLWLFSYKEDRIVLWIGLTLHIICSYIFLIIKKKIKKKNKKRKIKRISDIHTNPITHIFIILKKLFY